MKTTALVLALSFALLTACGGGGAKLSTRNQTMGQELIDLDKAHKEGILSDREYEKARKRIIKGKY